MEGKTFRQRSVGKKGQNPQRESRERGRKIYGNMRVWGDGSVFEIGTQVHNGTDGTEVCEEKKKGKEEKE